MRIIGIDPGIDGAVSLFSGLRFMQVVSTPVLQAKRRHCDTRRMSHLLHDLKSRGLEHAFVEKVSSRPGQGVASMFTFGVGFGLWLGILTALEIPHTLVPPQRWHKMVKGVAGGTPKERARLFFNTHFPGVSCKVKQVDAVLIGYWGARQMCSGDGFVEISGVSCPPTEGGGVS